MKNQRFVWLDTASNRPSIEGSKTTFLCAVMLRDYDNVKGLMATYDCLNDVFHPMNYKVNAIVDKYKIVE